MNLLMVKAEVVPLPAVWMFQLVYVSFPEVPQTRGQSLKYIYTYAQDTAALGYMRSVALPDIPLFEVAFDAL